MRRLYLILALGCAVGCARGAVTEEREGDVDAAVPRTDASQLVDASVTAPDSGACTTVTRNLLTNGNYEGGIAPWVEQRIDAGYPLVTNSAGPTGAQSGTYRAWLAGVATTPASNKDSLYQEVAIPATTTTLVLKGYFEVRSEETTTPVYDRATVELMSTTNTQLQLLRSLDDNGKTTAWQALNVPITANVKGQTVRLKLSTASDATQATSFLFDTLSLEATHCQ